MIGFIYEKVVEPRLEAQQSLERSQRETQEILDLTATLSPGETKTVSFRSAEKNTPIRQNYPFAAIDVINQTGENVNVYANELENVVLPVPDGAQNGDSYDDVGVTSVKIKNTGTSNIDLDQLKVIVSGTPEGLDRASI